MDAATLFENTMEWLRDSYGEHRFFVERDIVWTAQLRLLQEVERANLPYRVFDEHKIRKDARSGADLVIMEGGLVAVAAEFKYEPSHERKAPLQPEPTGTSLTRKKARQRAQDILATKLQRCGWGEIKKDMDKVRAYFHEDGAPAAYAILIDEGGYWRRQYPDALEGSEWRDWGNDVWVLWTKVGGDSSA